MVTKAEKREQQVDEYVRNSRYVSYFAAVLAALTAFGHSKCTYLIARALCLVILVVWTVVLTLAVVLPLAQATGIIGVVLEHVNQAEKDASKLHGFAQFAHDVQRPLHIRPFHH